MTRELTDCPFCFMPPAPADRGFSSDECGEMLRLPLLPLAERFRRSRLFLNRI